MSQPDGDQPPVDGGERPGEDAAPTGGLAVRPSPPSTANAPKLVEKPHPLSPLVRAWILILAAAWAVLRELFTTSGPRFPPLNWLTIGGGTLLVVLVLFSYLDWRATSFIVDADELRIETGVVTRSSQRIRFDRIQSVDITQPLGARVLGLAEITIDVGAEGGHKLRYLTRTRAAAVREFLLARAHGLRPARQEAAPRIDAFHDIEAGEDVLIRVPPQRLVTSTLLSHEPYLFVLPVLAIALFYVWRVPGGLAALLATNWVVFGLALPAVGGLWGFLVRRVSSQWGYSFVRSANGLKITRGLTNLSSQSVPRQRIQCLRIAQPFGWRRVGWYRVEMVVLGGHEVSEGDEAGDAHATLLPVGTRAEVDRVLSTIWPGLRVADVPIRHCPPRARWLHPLSHRWAGWGHNEEVTITQSGWLTRSRLILPHARVQSIQLEQGPLVRTFGLAQVSVHTTQWSTTGRTPYIASDDARRLILDETARAKQARMVSLTEPPAPGPPLLSPAAGIERAPEDRPAAPPN